MENITSVKQLATNFLLRADSPASEIVSRAAPAVNTDRTANPQSAMKPKPDISLTVASQSAPVIPVLGNLGKNISELSSQASSQRQQDKTQGLGLLSGATKFGQEVEGVYKFLATLSSAGITNGNQLAVVAKQYMFEQAGALLGGEEALSSNPAAITKAAQSTLTKKASAPAVAAGAANDPISSATGNLAEYGSKILGAAGAAYSIYQIFKGSLNPIDGAVSGMASGAYIGSQIAPGIGTTIGAVIGGIGGIFSGLFKSGKPKEQKERDAIRKQLQTAGILDQDWKITLANGAKFDMGKDGGAKLRNADGSFRSYTEFDLSNPLTQSVMQMAAPLAQMITGGHPRLTEEFTAYLCSAATSSAESINHAMQNLQAIYAQCGVDFKQVLQKLAT